MSWDERARCIGAPLDMFFPDGGDTRRAKAFCAGCPVWGECLAYGLDEDHGVWGGLNRAERARLVRLRHRFAAKPKAPENSRDIRLLLAASMPAEHLAEALDVSVEAVLAYRPQQRRRDGRYPDGRPRYTRRVVA